MRAAICFLAIAFPAGSVAAQSYSYDAYSYRHGGTYSIKPAETPDACAELCHTETACKAWSFQRETGGLGAPACELKSSIGPLEDNPLMTSGISPRYAEATEDLETKTDPDALLGGTDAEEKSAALRAPVELILSPPYISSANGRVRIIAYEAPKTVTEPAEITRAVDKTAAPGDLPDSNALRGRTSAP
ncbi:MAG: PAN domain-containing protein [Pseudomonadota bacterium]